MRAPMIAVSLSRGSYHFAQHDDERLGDDLVPVVMGLSHAPHRRNSTDGVAHVWRSGVGDWYVVDDDAATPIRVKRPTKAL